MTAPAAEAAETPTAAPPLVRVVTCTKLGVNGRCSWEFMFRGNMPRDWIGRGPWGFAWQEPKGSDFFHPAAITRRAAGEPTDAYVGDDGTPRWSIHFFESERGEILSCGFDDSEDLEGWRSLARDMAPYDGLILCMERGLFDRLLPVLEECGVLVEAHHHEGDLVTSYRRGDD